MTHHLPYFVQRNIISFRLLKHTITSVVILAECIMVEAVTSGRQDGASTWPRVGGRRTGTERQPIAQQNG
jgi:hypothetical protein